MRFLLSRCGFETDSTCSPVSFATDINALEDLFSLWQFWQHYSLHIHNIATKPAEPVSRQNLILTSLKSLHNFVAGFYLLLVLLGETANHLPQQSSSHSCLGLIHDLKSRGTALRIVWTETVPDCAG